VVLNLVTITKVSFARYHAIIRAYTLFKISGEAWIEKALGMKHGETPRRLSIGLWNIVLAIVRAYQYCR